MNTVKEILHDVETKMKKNCGTCIYNSSDRDCPPDLNDKVCLSSNDFYKWEPKGETKMKYTITLKGLIEQDACKDGLLWFMELAGGNGDSTMATNQNGIKGWCQHYDLHKFLKKDTVKPEYIEWFKNNGYAVEDKSELKQEIEKLKVKLQELEDKL